MQSDNRRELKSILFADVAGYTRLMQDDEEATHVGIQEMIEFFVQGCKEFDGEILEIRGDGIFALFNSAVNSVRFADKTQDLVEECNKKYEENRKIRFRIGIHLGDVVRHDKYRYGDSINIAARIEGLADTGGICISHSVYHQVKNASKFGYQNLGPQRLKNIKEPIEVYRITKDTNTAVLVASPRQQQQPLQNPPKPLSATEEIRPSVAVLPFKNTNGDPAFDYFSDGITEDIITNLSKFHSLFVISRSSSFTYKNKSLPATTIGRELGVRYLADGSVRTAGNRVRISIQLVDTDKDSTLWTEYYDRNLDYIFEVQDEISAIICNVTAAKIEKEERARLSRVLPSDLHAYECVLQGQQQIYQYTKTSVESARNLYQSALNYDPRYARALASISRTMNLEWRYSWSEDPEKSLHTALEVAKQSIEMDEDDARGYSELGFVNLYLKEHEHCISAYERARSLNPNDADIMAEMADALVHAGNCEEAIRLLEKAKQLNPFYPDMYLWNLSGAYFTLKKYGEAIKSVLQMNNPTEGYRLLAASHAYLGQTDKAKYYADQVRSAHPNFSLEHWQNILPDKYPEDTIHYVEGLKKAGL